MQTVLPDPVAPGFFEDIPGKLETQGDRFRMFSIGFSLYERAWTMRGMESLMTNFIEHPDSVRELLGAIADGAPDATGRIWTEVF